MAQELDDGEFWLPPQFLTDDDILMDFRPTNKNDSNGAGERLFGILGPFGPNFDLSSPVDSVMGSTETESDEEDYLVGLTRKMDDLWKVDYTKSWGMATSPQSTLCSVMGTCGCKQGSSRGSPNCPSPPANPGVIKSDAAWDLLYAAAGEVARMKMAEHGHAFNSNRGCLATGRKPCPISVPNKVHNPSLGAFSNNQNLSYHQLQALQFQQLKQQQMLKQPQQQYTRQQLVQNRARNVHTNNGPLPLSTSAWPTLQQSQGVQAGQSQQTRPLPPPPGTGMRAVFLGNPGGAKRECAGTGVFLPRQVGTQDESRNKRGCSTVLLPDRVVQALNLNLDATTDAQSQFQPKTFTPDYEAEMRYRNVLMAQQQLQQRRNDRQQPTSLIGNELRLPQEWTY